MTSKKLKNCKVQAITKIKTMNIFIIISQEVSNNSKKMKLKANKLKQTILKKV